MKIIISTLVLFNSLTSFANLADLKIKHNPQSNFIGIFGENYCSKLDVSIEVIKNKVLLFTCESTVPQLLPLHFLRTGNIQVFLKNETYEFNENGSVEKISFKNHNFWIVSYDEFDRPFRVKTNKGLLILEYQSESPFAIAIDYNKNRISLNELKGGT